MKSETIEQIEERLVKGLLDVVILGRLTKGRPLGGSDVILLINHELGILLSAGTVYSVLNSLERQGLIVGALEGRKTVYLLTDKGKENIKDISSAKHRITSLVSSLF